MFRPAYAVLMRSSRALGEWKKFVSQLIEPPTRSISGRSGSGSADAGGLTSSWSSASAADSSSSIGWAHAAAAIASNYTVTLASLASELLVREGIAPDANTALRYLMPLLRGTVDNLGTLGLPDALTVPLARGDVGTVARHLQVLEKCAPEMAHLYRHLARLTLPLAQEKGHLDDETMSTLEHILGSEKRTEE